MEGKKSLADRNLQELVKSKKRVIVYLYNGFQLHGWIHSFDEGVVILHDVKTDTLQMVFRNMISTVVL